MAEPVAVIIRGQLFASQADAARHFNVSAMCIHHALERGTLDGVGLGRNYHTRKPIWLDGSMHNSRADLARHIGVKANVIQNWIRRAKQKSRTSMATKFGIISWPSVT